MIALLIFAQAAAGAPMSMPAFLSGCWEEKGAEGKFTEECWTDTRGSLMLGSGRDGNGDRVGHWEWMRIERADDGSVTFYASPKGAPPVGFKATAADGNSITFVNAGNDYPQRVAYRRTDAGLEAEISLVDGSKPNRWSYRRPGAVK